MKVPRASKLVVVIEDDPLVLEATGGLCVRGAAGWLLRNPTVKQFRKLSKSVSARFDRV